MGAEEAATCDRQLRTRQRAPWKTLAHAVQDAWAAPTRSGRAAGGQRCAAGTARIACLRADRTKQAACPSRVRAVPAGAARMGGRCASWTERAARMGGRRASWAERAARSSADYRRKQRLVGPRVAGHMC